MKLLWIVEVDPSRRIMCQAPGCGHSVYKRIHLCETDEGYRVFGSSCFSKLIGFGDVLTNTPRYGSKDGQKLTDEERLELLDNTQEFIHNWCTRANEEEERIAKQNAPYGAQLVQDLDRQRREMQARLLEIQIELQRRNDDQQKPRRLRFEAWHTTLGEHEKHLFYVAKTRVEAALKKKYSIDPKLPGWVGWVNCDARRLVENPNDAYEPGVLSSALENTNVRGFQAGLGL